MLDSVVHMTNYPTVDSLGLQLGLLCRGSRLTPRGALTHSTGLDSAEQFGADSSQEEVVGAHFHSRMSLRKAINISGCSPTNHAAHRRIPMLARQHTCEPPPGRTALIDRSWDCRG